MFAIHYVGLDDSEEVIGLNIWSSGGVDMSLGIHFITFGCGNESLVGWVVGRRLRSRGYVQVVVSSAAQNVLGNGAVGMGWYG